MTKKKNQADFDTYKPFYNYFKDKKDASFKGAKVRETKKRGRANGQRRVQNKTGNRSRTGPHSDTKD